MMMTPEWIRESIFYHIYPLGLCGAPEWNTLSSPVEYRLEKLTPWLDHIQSLGANAIYLGPVFEASSHGYDVVDYYQVDRRLGDKETLRQFSNEVHQRGMSLVLDAVFNHVGRDFWAFKDVQEHGEGSEYRDWFQNLRFNDISPMGDPFNYENWQGHYKLVKLNLSHPDVRKHLFDAVAMWMDQFYIDGLRLDAADCLDFDFLRALHGFTKAKRSDFWLMGEVVHGNYRDWVNPEMLDSVTNYQTYKGMYSSLLEKNYFEIAYEINRAFGSEGIYKGLNLYNFVDNHDVDRVVNRLSDPTMLYPLYLLLFTMPGIPSIYYGSEWGLDGQKGPWSDNNLRPELDLKKMNMIGQTDLLDVIKRLAVLWHESKALRLGDYKPSHVNHQQFAFIRQFEGQIMLIILNSAAEEVELTLDLPWQKGVFLDQLNGKTGFKLVNGQLRVTVPPCWGRVLSFE